MLPLAALPPGAEARFGGKAAGLRRLLDSGARVPAGFAIEATTLAPDLWEPADREELLRNAAPLLARGPVAVRSSAPGEDSATRSFAGLFETVLDVGDPESLLAAVGRCVASGASTRVSSYTGDTAALPVGVVVQSQVASRAAGVCFTIDPTGRDGAAVVEAVKGKGEALVSGHTQPERWRVYRSGLGVLLARREPGPTVLAEADALRIVGEAADLAAKQGIPLDLEWALDEGGVWWLQARPITAAREPPGFTVDRYCEGVDDGPVSVWSNWNVRETMPDAFSPLTWSLWRDSILPTVIEDGSGVPRDMPGVRHGVPIDLVNGRPYWNMNALLAAPFGERLVRGLLGLMDPEASKTINALMDEGVLRKRRTPPLHWPSLPRMVLASARTGWRVLQGFRPARVMQSFEAVATAVRRRPPLDTLTDAALLAEMKLIERSGDTNMAHGNPALVSAMTVYVLAARAFASHPAAQRVLAAGARGPTTRISEDLDALARAARPLAGTFAAHPGTSELRAALTATAEGRAWLAALDTFLLHHGQRGPREFDLGSARWAEDPAMILDLVRASLRAPPGEALPARLARVAHTREAAIEEAVAASPAWKRPLMRGLARAVIHMMPLREAPKHYAMHVFLRMRRAALEAGRRLVARGHLGTAESVFLLEWPEIGDLLGRAPFPELAPRLHARAERLARLQALPAPACVRSDGVPVESHVRTGNSDRDGPLRGIGVAGGRVSGVVRVLSTPDPNHLPEGAVLVCEFADPGWTPLFPRAAAVVMEVGGLMCHAAVVAREIGVPAVFGVAGARRRLHDGQRVTVDGEAGTVTVD
jgi:pyruvate,water dikinase